MVPFDDKCHAQLNHFPVSVKCL